MIQRTPAPISVGIRRGILEFKQDFSLGRLPGQLMWPLVTLAALYFFRDYQIGGVALGAMMLPSTLGMFTAVFGAQLVVQYLAADREDGTLLRARSTPRGIPAYLIGKLILCTLTLLTYLVIVAIPGAFIVSGLAPLTWERVLTLGGVLVLGMVAAQTIGAVVGAFVPSVRAAGYVSLLLMGLIAISGIFYPMTALPGWLQVLGQVSPIYWVGHGMRAALLPEAYVGAELFGAWRVDLTMLVLAGWTVVGIILAPATLRAMTRKESGTRLRSRQEKAGQRQI